MLKKARKYFRRRKQVGIYEPPPPYGEVCAEHSVPAGRIQSYAVSQAAEPQIELLHQSFADLDLLAECSGLSNQDNESVQSHSAEENISNKEDNLNNSSEKMGQKASLFTGQHRSKVSLTWVLREQSDIQYNSCNDQNYLDRNKLRHSPNENSSQHYQRSNQKYDNGVNGNNNDYYDRSNGDRVIGRNKQYQFYSNEPNPSISKCKKSSVCRNYPDSWSESQGDFGNSGCNKKYRHKRRKSRPVEKQENFGYEIKDIDFFLTEASIDNPGNIPVVVTHPSVLYQTQSGSYQKEMSLSLGMVVNAVFKNQQWLYVQTPHGEEGYILYASCLPLGILPSMNRNKLSKKAPPCWESTLDLYPQPCGNMTDSEKEQLRGGTKSECGRGRSKHKYYTDTMSEKTFDKLYLKAASSCSKLKDIGDDNLSYKQTDDIHRKVKYPTYKHKRSHKENVTRHTLMVVESDYIGSANTLSVKKGEVVILVQGESVEADVDSEWFYVRNWDGKEGFIPAAIAGHGYL